VPTIVRILHCVPAMRSLMLLENSVLKSSPSD
jgi:hypothetical protein